MRTGKPSFKALKISSARNKGQTFSVPETAITATFSAYTKTCIAVRMQNYVDAQSVIAKEMHASLLFFRMSSAITLLRSGLSGGRGARNATVWCGEVSSTRSIKSGGKEGKDIWTKVRRTPTYFPDSAIDGFSDSWKVRDILISLLPNIEVVVSSMKSRRVKRERSKEGASGDPLLSWPIIRRMVEKY